MPRSCMMNERTRVTQDGGCSLEIEAELVERIEVKAPIGAAFELITDVPRSVKHLPNFKSIRKVKTDVYALSTHTIKLPMVEIVAAYTALYQKDRSGHEAWWDTLSGNPTVTGRFKLRSRGAGVTEINLSVRAVQRLALPSLVKAAVRPLLVRELERTIRGYLANLKADQEA